MEWGPWGLKRWELEIKRILFFFFLENEGAIIFLKKEKDFNMFLLSKRFMNFVFNLVPNKKISSLLVMGKNFILYFVIIITLSLLSDPKFWFYNCQYIFFTI